MQNLFVGGSSEIAQCAAKLKKNIDNLSRKKSKSYKKNIIVKNYSKKNINKALSKVKKKYENVVIFNGWFSNSFITNFDENDFYKSLKINLIVPLEIAKIIIKKDILKKNGCIYFISSIASKKNFKGNAYYSIAKNALELSAKILSQEQKSRNLRISLINIGLVNNKLGHSTQKFISEIKKKKINFMKLNFVADKLNKIILNNKKNFKR